MQNEIVTFAMSSRRKERTFRTTCTGKNNDSASRGICTQLARPEVLDMLQDS
jgi:hypothetical protein